MKIIAIIPARANSKRILNKNLLKINNVPLLKIIYQNLKKMKIFSKIVLSTESLKIKKLAQNIGYDFIIDRPKKLSKDNTSTKDVIIHSINNLEKKIRFSHVCCVYPMAILFEKQDLLTGFKILKKKNDIVFPSLKFSHPIQRAFKIKKSQVKYNLSDKQISKNTKSFLEHFYDAGQFYIGQTYAWKNFKKSKKKSFSISATRAVDVDNYEDLNILKVKYLLKKKII